MEAELTPRDRAKRTVGVAAVQRYVRPGMLLGLGSGTTSHWFVRALGQAVSDGLAVHGVPTSTSTHELAVSLAVSPQPAGAPVVPNDFFELVVSLRNRMCKLHTAHSRL